MVAEVAVVVAVVEVSVTWVWLSILRSPKPISSRMPACCSLMPPEMLMLLLLPRWLLLELPITSAILFPSVLVSSPGEPPAASDFLGRFARRCSVPFLWPSPDVAGVDDSGADLPAAARGAMKGEGGAITAAVTAVVAAAAGCNCCCSCCMKVPGRCNVVC